jgi:hypothetical protein
VGVVEVIAVMPTVTVDGAVTCAQYDIPAVRVWGDAWQMSVEVLNTKGSPETGVEVSAPITRAEPPMVAALEVPLTY